MNNELIEYLEREFRAKYYDITALKFTQNMKALEYINKVIPQIKLPVYSFIKPDLDADMRTCNMEGVCHFILMRDVLTDPVTLTEIAHEFGHLYYGDKGYPLTRPASGKIEDMSKGTILSNTIMDPIINRDLADFGLDMVEYMKKGVQIQAPELMFGYPEYGKMNKYQKHYVKCLLIDKIQEWKIINNAIPNAFIDIADKKHKRLLKESRDFVKRIEAMGTNTPGKCKKILEMLVKENDMEHEILID